MQKDSKEYASVMNGLSQIPGLNLPIPGLTNKGYHPSKLSENSTQPKAFKTPMAPEIESILHSNRSEEISEKKERKSLSKQDKTSFLSSLKSAYDYIDNPSLSESIDLKAGLIECLSHMRTIVDQNEDNYYLIKAYLGLSEAIYDLFNSKNHLKMVMKNTAEYIKSM